MDPLFSLAPLAADIEHASKDQLDIGNPKDKKSKNALNAQLAHSESGLVNTSGLCSGTQYICYIWNILWGCYPYGLVEKTETEISIRSGENSTTPYSKAY